MVSVNKIDLSGIVTQVTERMVTFEQNVEDKMLSEFCLFIPASIRAEIAEIGLKKGDEILVMNAQVYCKEGQTLFRIVKPDQVVKLNREPEIGDYFLGEIEAKEKFI